MVWRKQPMCWRGFACVLHVGPRMQPGDWNKDCAYELVVTNMFCRDLQAITGGSPPHHCRLVQLLSGVVSSVPWKLSLDSDLWRPRHRHWIWWRDIIDIISNCQCMFSYCLGNLNQNYSSRGRNPQSCRQTVLRYACVCPTEQPHGKALNPFVWGLPYERAVISQT
jgi:hypothetical protein